MIYEPNCYEHWSLVDLREIHDWLYHLSIHGNPGSESWQNSYAESRFYLKLAKEAAKRHGTLCVEHHYVKVEEDRSYFVCTRCHAFSVLVGYA